MMNKAEMIKRRMRNIDLHRTVETGKIREETERIVKAWSRRRRMLHRMVATVTLPVSTSYRFRSIGSILVQSPVA